MFVAIAYNWCPHRTVAFVCSELCDVKLEESPSATPQIAHRKRSSCSWSASIGRCVVGVYRYNYNYYGKDVTRRLDLMRDGTLAARLELAAIATRVGGVVKNFVPLLSSSQPIMKSRADRVGWWLPNSTSRYFYDYSIELQIVWMLKDMVLWLVRNGIY